jgi:hypothetical protein
MKIVAWAEQGTPGPMAEALAAHNVPYRLDQGHDGWMFSVRLRDWIFVRSIAADAGFEIDASECEADADHFAGEFSTSFRAAG